MIRNDVGLISELSPMQQAMLFASLYAPGSGVYVVQLSLRLTGRLDVAAFERAFRRVVDRHDALRTGFHWEDLEKPMQVVLGDVDLKLRRESWRGLDGAGQEARLGEYLDADRESGFELSEPPLMRLALFELGAETWHLVWSLHHLVVDGWSVGLLLKELFTCYAALAAGREPALARARSYGDYIAWLQRQDAAEAEAFWRRSLAGLATPTLIAGGDGRGAAGFRQSQRQSVRLSQEATTALRELARRHRLTLNTLMQGAWALLLAQTNGGGEVVFGGTVAGRPGDLPGVDSIVGPFINTLPVRVEVDPERPLLPWLEELQERQSEARRYEHAPLYEIQTWSGLPAGTALFDNILVFESYPLDGSLAGLLPELSMSRLTVNEQTNYPLNLVVVPGPELSLEVLCDSRRIDAPAAVRLLERLTGALRAFAADPERRVGEVPLLLEGERHQLLLEWNDTAAGFPREASLPALFAAVAAAMPEAPAVVEGEEVWSYGRLAEAARRQAGQLAALGVGPGARVGVAMERSADLVVAFLAILEAGAAYVPLDPGYPDERLLFLLEDTGAAVVLVHERTRERMAGLWTCEDVKDIKDSKDPKPLQSLPSLGGGGSQLAYVLYTSGSTGRPKGVAVPHRAVVRLVRETNYLTLAPGDRLAFNANPSFDSTTFEIWATLLSGAALVVVPQEVLLAPVELAALLEREKVTVLHLTAALFAQVAREAPAALGRLSCVLFGGEASSPAAVARALDEGRPRRLLQMYGPTESTTFATFHRVAEVPAGATTVPIGRPLANTAAYVLDPRQQPSPLGSAGELWLGGAGLAWGYLNRPELTAERFVPDPWSLEPGGRLYRTGDLVRLRPDGWLEFQGRLDHQVKIRGFRIEPGEVESVLAGHPAVAECAVLARRDAPGAARLVAYVVWHPTDPTDRSDSTSALAAWLRERLPEYMLPGFFVTLEALPLTPNGKVDRRALPVPELAVSPSDSFVAPSDPVEELLAGIWGEVLGHERVGVHDDFFALGGHSLLATQVASRIRGVLGVELALRSVFEEPTVAGLARVVREGLAGEALVAPPLVRVPRDLAHDLPLSFAQQRLWFIDQLEPGNPGYNIPSVMRLLGELSIPRLAQAFTEVVRRHEVLRTTFASREGRAVLVIHPPAALELPVLDLAALPDEEREARAGRLAVGESLRPFDLEQGPLLRTVLLRLAEREHVLVLTMHHIVSDGWSMGVLVRELQDLYRGRTLPELPIQYADFAAWQRRWLAGEVLELQLAWWREHLEGTSGVLELPTDHPRPAVLSLRGAEHRFALDRELSRRIAELGRREGVTPFMILGAALAALLSRLSGQLDLNLGAPIANRNRIETEGLIGFFVNTLVLRAQVGSAEVFLDLLAQMRDAGLGAYAHQDLPFEKLVDELQPERDLSRSPLAQVALAVNNAPASRTDLEGLRLVPENPPSEVAKFDLAFIFAEMEEGCFSGSLQYATELYEATTAARLTRQLTTFLDALSAEPEQPLSDLSPLTPEERHQVLFEWNDTAGGLRAGLLMHQLFEEQVDARPEAPAAAWKGRTWSYGELEGQANRLAGLLRGLGVERGTPVGVWLERSLHMLAAVLGILKAGGTYVPLDAAWPAERVETILARTGAPVIVVDRSTLPVVEQIRWRLPRLADAVCLDVQTPELEPERLDVESIRSLFDFVAERATDRNDRVMAGGFISRATGLPFSEAEVDEYRDRVLSLASPWLRPGARVLEVGSGSGLLLWEMARQVERCVGLDPSERTQERNREHARAEGISNVELPVGFAHEIGGLFAPGSFDLVLLASTVQFFPGPRYLEKVVADALRLLAPGGALLIADVVDARIEQATDLLALDEDLFRDLAPAEIHHRADCRGGFANELGERYDVILHPGETERRKRTWTGWHVERASSVRPPTVGSPEDVAYVIHTSGSTGTPKGIAVQHAPAVNLISWVNQTFGVGPADRLLFVTSLCFDLSVYDVFGTLAAGGTVHVASEEALREPAQLVRMLREEPVTIWDSAPAALQQLAPLFPAAEARPLRLVMLSGDWIPVPLPDQVRAAFPGTRVMSLGGATEATVWSNWYPVGAVDPRWPSIPYGRPIANARYHVLDDGLLPCPISIPGDLYIGGECLCVGYAGQPELTAAAFVPDPFAMEPGARLYRTGDRARFFRDGNLEFLGRADQQVKVRGYRIELGEIEVVLLRHPAVRDAVVLARDDRLVAYVVPDPTDPTDPTDRSDSTSALAAWLRDRLPQYMVPSAFVLLDAMPVTANGKLDRKALPDPEVGSSEESYEAPSDPVEQTLADLWGEILGLDRVGVRDNFFTLGGHSLLATQLMSRLRGTLGVELALRELFEAPTIAELARTVRRARQAEAAPAPPPLVPAPRDAWRGELPLSFAQQRLWFIDQLEPDTPVYNVFNAVRLIGAARQDLLRLSLEQVVRRHETLRTTFSHRGGAPVQIVHAALPPDVATIDLAGLAPEGRERELHRLAEHELLRPFDLANGPLVRARFVTLGERETAALLTLHHIVSDEWSMRVLVEELCTVYAALARSANPSLPELPVQYADYAVWQRGWLRGDVLAAELAYWRRHLDGAPELLELPADRPRPAVQSFRGTTSWQILPLELAAALRSAGRDRSTTLFMTCLAAFQVLLARLTGETEIVIGTPIAGRNRLETERLIGFFVNTLAMRGRLSFRLPLGELLERTRETAIEVQAHQDLPFELLVEELNPRRSLSHTPLFQVMMNVGTIPLQLELPELSLAPVGDLRTGTAPFDLTLTVLDLGESPRLGLEYSTDLFDSPTVERLHGFLREVLRALATRPELPVGEVSLWSPAERHQVLTEWNDTVAEPVGSLNLHGLVETWARLSPGAPAVLFQEGAWSFAELDGRANRLARRLRGLGAGTEVVVGVQASGGPELALGILGVLKAGGAFLPLDPSWPASRRMSLLEDAGARVLAGCWTGEPDEVLPAGCVALRIDPEEPWSGSAPDVPEVSPDQMAYVIYTSGSTGRPKGVMVGHGAAVRFAVEVAAQCGLGSEDRFLQFASPGFDVLIEEVFPVWSRGGAVVFAGQDELLTPAGLERVLSRQGVTGLELPTPYWQEWVDDLDRRGEAPPQPLRRLLLGCEKPSLDRLERWGRHGVPLVHVFGLTETTVTSALHRWNGEPVERELPIGRPVGGTSLYVLDQEGVPVPGGVPGELFVCGAGVARGYLGRPDLTAERFVPDPFSVEPGARAYRTGDLARYRPDGTLDFLGRIDQQVKVRGFRVEPGEVAAVLELHPAVSEAFVAAREVRPGDRRLVAYVVPAPGGVVSRAALRSHVGVRLPEYMVPSEIVEMPALPRTANGKIDRARLPVPDLGERPEEGEGPRTPIEALLAGIWCEVLGLESVGRNEDFFALGGHSLLATQVVSRIRGGLGVDLPLRTLFEAPTVAGLARAVGEIRRGRQAPPVPAILPVPRPQEPLASDLPLSFAQQRLWLIDQLDPGTATYNVPSAVRLRGALQDGLLARIFTEVVRRHETLRTTFVPRAGGPVQVIAPAGSPAARPELPLVDLAHLPEAAREAEGRAIAQYDARRSFDLRNGPLLRLLLLRMGTEDHLLLVTMHHIVSDGWSVGILVREITALYQAFSRGKGSPLPELPVQYADFAVWQRDWLQGEVLDEQLAYWRGQLAGAPQVLDLPTDRPRPAARTYRGATRLVSLSSGLSAAVRELSRREGVTPFMTLLAAWAVLLGRHAGQDDLLLGMPVAGRNRQEIEALIGFFINTLVLRVDLAGAPAFGELVGRVRESSLGAFSHADIPFERLVEELVAERNPAVSPLFQALFVLQNAPVEDLAVEGLVLSPMPLDSDLAKLDLTFSLLEGAEGFTGALEHNTDLFDGGTAERLLARFVGLLEAAMADPGRALPDLPLLLPAELEQVLRTWNDTAREYPRDASLPELFAEVAREHPEAPAILGEDGAVWTYRRLDEEADRLARYLRSLGVGLETPVGIAMERSPELILGTLAIVKAGGTYVPLDASYPDERLTFMLEDTGARLVLVHAATRERMAALGSALVEVDSKDELPLPSLESLPSLGGGSLAYVIYTSGSTGRPKGVAVPHRAIVRLVRETDYVQLGPGDRVAHLSNTSFDAATFEIWGALLTGAAAVVVPRETVLVPADFAALLRREKVTALFLTTALFNQVVRDAPGAFATVRAALVGGDAVDPGAVARALEQEGPERLLNSYGPTESTTFAAWHHFREVPPGATTLPIGLPLANTTLYVLDRWLRPVPPGVTGELFIGGDGLARGYWNRPELTAERFIPDEWTRGGRLYRTGDLVRRRLDGPIEFLGRRDNQVKIRGFRIEPGEIEAVLQTHPDVREAAVLAVDDGAGGRRLAAWVVARDPAADLRAWLGERLPAYMIPSAWVFLEALPLTANGKVDRRALRLEPESSRSVTGSYAAPANPVEDKLAALWADLLQIDQVGVDDDFFALGGHSLLATQMVTRVREVLGVELPLRRLFQTPSIRQLARSLSGVLMMRISGELSAGALERALGELAQAIAPPDDLPVLDLSNAPDDAREEWALQLALEEGRHPSGDGCGPLPRFGLLRLGSREHLLLVTRHGGAEKE
ncbi:MAG TPA: amino acid adenylation domain-containing protein [Thermoanaerobaculia bacterium]|nr:amino acid adenylation domain-containing protein [Thermoanaerobaculia bacterium]